MEAVRIQRMPEEIRMIMEKKCQGLQLKAIQEEEIHPIINRMKTPTLLKKEPYLLIMEEKKPNLA
jgi:hypothetical protein